MYSDYDNRYMYSDYDNRYMYSDYDNRYTCTCTVIMITGIHVHVQ